VRLVALTFLAMLAFAGNSLLCRLALRDGAIDAASFTALRLVSGALMLWLLVGLGRARGGAVAGRGNWLSALALFAYAAGFSFAYRGLTVATGALLLFGAVQVTMIGVGLWRGERLHGLQWTGVLAAFAGLVLLLAPGLSAPPWREAALMLGAGAAWGLYSLRGRGAGDPLQVSAGNFLRTLPLALALSALTLASARLSAAGVLAALASGALASGLGYALWYTVLPALRASSAAIVQLGVPVLAAVGGIVWLGEPLAPRLVLAAAAVLGGIALVTLAPPPATRSAD
jgi:drug/metabolite transporter (DMT)-like permease